MRNRKKPGPRIRIAKDDLTTPLVKAESRKVVGELALTTRVVKCKRKKETGKRLSTAEILDASRKGKS